MNTTDTNEFLQKLDKFPSIIAHEVNRASLLQENKEYFGLLIQIKDSFEVIVKSVCLMGIMTKPDYYDEIDEVHKDHWSNFYLRIQINPEKTLTANKMNSFNTYFKNIFPKPEQQINNLEQSVLVEYTIDELIEYLKYREAILRMLHKEMTLGDWVDLLRLVKDFKMIASPLRNIARHVYAYIKNDGENSFNLTNWRNNEIGHGALKLKENKMFLLDLQLKMELLYCLIDDVYEDFSFICFKYKKKDNNFFDDFVGPKKAVNFQEGEYELKLEITAEDQSVRTFQVAPLIIIDEQGFYLFDSFHYWKQFSYLMDYPNGRRKSSEKGLDYWIKEKKFNYSVYNSDKYGKTHSRYKSAEMKSFLKNLVSCKNYLQPHYLIDPVIDFLEEQVSGILLLSLDRGMGKTTFCKSMDVAYPSINNFLAEDRYLIRNIYANSYTMYDTRTFIDELRDVFKRGGDFEGFTLEYSEQNDNETHRQNIATFLEKIMDALDCQKIIVVIDALDEIPQREKKKFLDCIPRSEQLTKGVYFILTSRNRDVPKQNLFERGIFDDIQVMVDTCNIQKLIFSLKDSGYQEFVRKFLLHKPSLSKYAMNSFLEELKQDFEKSRMVYLNIYKSCLLKNESYKLSNHQSILQDHLAQIAEHTGYSSRYFKIIHGLFGLLVIVKEPITIYEIHYLLPMYTNEIELIGHLYDLEGFIQVSHSRDSNNLYGIAHHYWWKQIELNYQEWIEDTRKELKSLIKSVTIESIAIILNVNKIDQNTKKIDEEIDNVLGLITLFSNAKHIYKNEDVFLKDLELEKKLLEVAKYITSLKSHAREFPILKIRKDTLMGQLEEMEANKNPVEISEVIVSVAVLYALAKYRREINSEENKKSAGVFFRKALKLLVIHQMKNTFDFFDILNSYGLLLMNSRKHKKAISAFISSYQYYKEHHEGCLDYHKKYGQIIANIGIEKRALFIENKELKYLDEAIYYSKASIEEKKIVQENSIKEGDGDSLAFSNHSLGLSYWNRGVFIYLKDEKISDFEKYSKTPFLLRTKLILKPIETVHQKEFMKARESFEESLHIFNTLIEQGYRINESIYAYCNSHLGDALWILGEIELAKLYYQEAKKILEPDGKSKNETVFRMSCYNLIHLIELDRELRNFDDMRIHQNELLDLLEYRMKIGEDKLKFRKEYQDYIDSDPIYKVNVQGLKPIEEQRILPLVAATTDNQEVKK